MLFTGSFLFVEPGVSLEAVSLSARIGVRFAYIPPSPDPTLSCAKLWDLLGKVVVVVVIF